MTQLYFLAPALQQIFINKDDQTLLKNGYVKFYKDNARTEGKDVYRQERSGNDYVFVSLGDKVVLNASGAFDEAIYFAPFKKVNGEFQQEIETYFIEVYSEDNVLQLTRENYPDIYDSSANDQSNKNENYISNGQFLLHNNFPKTKLYEAGEFRGDIEFSSIDNNDRAAICQGGIYFVRNKDSSSKDIITFERSPDYREVIPPDRNPRYILNVGSQSQNNDQIKDLRFRFYNVHRFSGDDNFTFIFSSIGQQVNTLNMFLIKNFGLNAASTEESISIGSIQIGPSWNRFAISFSFGDNDNKELSKTDTDYIEIAIRFPLNVGFNISISETSLYYGSLNSTQLFPYTENRSMVGSALGGGFPVPDPDGYDLLLSPILTKEGWKYNSSEISKISLFPIESVPDGWLLCNGAQYSTSDYSDIGIPYNRLYSVLSKNDPLNLSIGRYGTGLNYSTAIVNKNNSPESIILSNNRKGVVSDFVDGSVSTGFTFTNIHKGVAGYNAHGILWPSEGGTENYMFMYYDYGPSTPTPKAGTSGFSIYGGLSFFTSYINFTNASNLASKYWEFSSSPAQNADLVNYYVWYKVDGAGADPKISGRTGILINLLSTDDENIVRYKTQNAINGLEEWNISVVNGASVVQSSYFEFSSKTSTDIESYYVWYNKDSAGVDPKISGKIGIEVNVSSADSTFDVAQKTCRSINSANFSVPDFRGRLLRFWNDESIYDDSVRTRSTLVPGIYGDKVGTYQRMWLNHVNGQLGFEEQYEGYQGTLEWYTQRSVPPTSEIQEKSENISLMPCIKY